MTTDGDPVGLVISQQGDANASSATPTDQTYGIDGSYTHIDHTTGSLTATLPDLGTAATVCIVSLNGIEYQDGLTIIGATTLPQQEWDAVIYRDAAFTPAEKEAISNHFKGYGHRTLSLDFSAQSYAIGDRPIEDVQRLLTVDRATPKWVYSASGKLTEVPAHEPAYQHDPVTGEPQGVLIEESRTNVVIDSKFYPYAYSYKPQLTIKQENIVGPDGVNAPLNKLVVDDGESAGYFLCYRTNPDIVSGDPVSISAFFYPDGVNVIQISARGSDGVGYLGVTCDLTTGEVLPSSAAWGVPLQAERVMVERLPSGWVRVGFSDTLTVGDGSSNPRLEISMSDSSGTLTGDGVKGVFYTGMQIENGSEFPSSYIPTEDAQVTRAADNVSRELGEEFNPNSGTYTIRAAVPTGETVATLGSVSVTSTSDEMTTYTLSYSSDPGATELVLGNGLFDSIDYAPGVSQ